MSGGGTANKKADYRRTLASIIRNARVKGSVGAEQKALFVKAWLDMVTTNGLDISAIDLLFDGFDIALSEPLYAYALSAPEENVCQKLSLSKRNQVDKDVCALKVMLNLLALELASPSSDESVAHLCSRLLGLGRKKGKPHAALRSSVGPLLVKPLEGKAISPRARIDSTVATKLLGLLEEPVGLCARAAKATKTTSVAAESIISWLKHEAFVGVSDDVVYEQQGISSQVGVEDASDVTSEEVRNDAESKTPVDEDRKMMLKTKQGEAPEDASSRLEEGNEQTPDVPAKRRKLTRVHERADVNMDVVLTFLSSYQREHEAVTKRYRKVISERERAVARAEQLERDLYKAEGEIRELRTRESRLLAELEDLNREHVSLSEQNKDLEDNVRAANEMVGMVDRQYEDQIDVMKKRIGRQLMPDYRDYLAGAEMPIGDEVGESMRFLLESVFKKLMENGIKF